MVIAQQFVPFVIPCKPTSPKVKVELIHEDGEVTVTDFNETIGFTVVIDSDEEKMILAECIFSRDGEAALSYCQIFLNCRSISTISKFLKAYNQVFSSLHA